MASHCQTAQFFQLPAPIFLHFRNITRRRQPLMPDRGAAFSGAASRKLTVAHEPSCVLQRQLRPEGVALEVGAPCADVGNVRPARRQAGPGLKGLRGGHWRRARDAGAEPPVGAPVGQAAADMLLICDRDRLRRPAGGLARGEDDLQGGLGQDVYRFDTAPNAATNIDQIIGFSSADDSIELDNAVFAALGAAVGPLAASQFQIGAAANDGFDRIIYNNAAGALFYDADGNTGGGGAAIQFATLSGAPVLALGTCL